MTLLSKKNKNAYSNIIWLISLVSAIFMASCKDDSQIELPVQDQNLNTLYRDSFSIETSTRLRPDFINTTDPVAGLVGTYEDPIFGDVKAQTYFNLSLADEFRNFGNNPTCDSVVLYIPLQRIVENGVSKPNYVGDTLSGLQAEIYELAEELGPDVTFSIDDNLQLEETPIAQVDFSINPYSQAVKLYLPTEFGQRIINESSVGQTTFRERFPGLSIKPVDETGNVIYGLDLRSTESALKIYYTNSSNNSLLFGMTLSNASFNSISTDRSGTVLENLSKNNPIPASANNHNYIQGGTGVGTWIEIQDLAAFRTEEENVIINKAILKVPLDFTTYGGEEEDPVYFVKLLKTDGAGNFVYNNSNVVQSVDNFAGTLLNRNTIAFSFNDEKKEYQMDITGYIQDIVLGKEEANPLFMVPFYAASSVNRSVIFTPETARELKLEIYFTRIQ